MVHAVVFMLGQCFRGEGKTPEEALRQLEEKYVETASNGLFKGVIEMAERSGLKYDSAFTYRPIDGSIFAKHGSGGVVSPCGLLYREGYTSLPVDPSHIGYLVGKVVICKPCVERFDCLEKLTTFIAQKTGYHKSNVSRLFRSNIGDYKQTCHICSEVLVKGKTPAWCELYPKDLSILWND